MELGYEPARNLSAKRVGVKGTEGATEGNFEIGQTEILDPKS
jgi:hypothetical protein